MSREEKNIPFFRIAFLLVLLLNPIFIDCTSLFIIVS